MNLCNIINIVIESLVSSFFGVIGGIIPITFLLLLSFYKIQQDYRNILPSERKILEKLKEGTKQEEGVLEKIKERKPEVSTELQQELFLLEIKLQRDIFTHELEILNQEMWINKIETSGFLKWIGYNISSRYFKDYFKK